MDETQLIEEPPVIVEASSAVAVKTIDEDKQKNRPLSCLCLRLIGCSKPRLVMLASGPNRIGRAAHSDVCILDKTVSKTHAIVDVVGEDEVNVRDEGATSRVRVITRDDEKAIVVGKGETRRLNIGDKLVFGTGGIKLQLSKMSDDELQQQHDRWHQTVLSLDDESDATTKPNGASTKRASKLGGMLDIENTLDDTALDEVSKTNKNGPDSNHKVNGSHQNGNNHVYNNKLCIEDTDEETDANSSNIDFHLELNQSTYSNKSTKRVNIPDTMVPEEDEVSAAGVGVVAPAAADAVKKDDENETACSSKQVETAAAPVRTVANEDNKQDEAVVIGDTQVLDVTSSPSLIRPAPEKRADENVQETKVASDDITSSTATVIPETQPSQKDADVNETKIVDSTIAVEPAVSASTSLEEQTLKEEEKKEIVQTKAVEVTSTNPSQEDESIIISDDEDAAAATASVMVSAAAEAIPEPQSTPTLPLQQQPRGHRLKKSDRGGEIMIEATLLDTSTEMSSQPSQSSQRADPQALAPKGRIAAVARSDEKDRQEKSTPARVTRPRVSKEAHVKEFDTVETTEKEAKKDVEKPEEEQKREETNSTIIEEEKKMEVEEKEEHFLSKRSRGRRSLAPQKAITPSKVTATTEETTESTTKAINVAETDEEIEESSTKEKEKKHEEASSDIVEDEKKTDADEKIETTTSKRGRGRHSLASQKTTTTVTKKAVETTTTVVETEKEATRMESAAKPEEKKAQEEREKIETEETVTKRGRGRRSLAPAKATKPVETAETRTAEPKAETTLADGGNESPNEPHATAIAPELAKRGRGRSSIRSTGVKKDDQQPEEPKEKREASTKPAFVVEETAAPKPAVGRRKRASEIIPPPPPSSSTTDENAPKSGSSIMRRASMRSRPQVSYVPVRQTFTIVPTAKVKRGGKDDSIALRGDDLEEEKDREQEDKSTKPAGRKSRLSIVADEKPKSAPKRGLKKAADENEADDADSEDNDESNAETQIKRRSMIGRGKKQQQTADEAETTTEYAVRPSRRGSRISLQPQQEGKGEGEEKATATGLRRRKSIRASIGAAEQTKQAKAAAADTYLYDDSDGGDHGEEKKKKRSSATDTNVVAQRQHQAEAQETTTKPKRNRKSKNNSVLAPTIESTDEGSLEKTNLTVSTEAEKQTTRGRKRKSDQPPTTGAEKKQVRGGRTARASATKAATAVVDSQDEATKSPKTPKLFFHTNRRKSPASIGVANDSTASASNQRYSNLIHTTPRHSIAAASTSGVVSSSSSPNKKFTLHKAKSSSSENLNTTSGARRLHQISSSSSDDDDDDQVLANMRKRKQVSINPVVVEAQVTAVTETAASTTKKTSKSKSPSNRATKRASSSDMPPPPPPPPLPEKEATSKAAIKRGRQSFRAPQQAPSRTSQRNALSSKNSPKIAATGLILTDKVQQVRKNKRVST